MIAVETKRLVLRQWKPSDRQPFAQMNADSRVMEYFPATLSKQQSDSLVERFTQDIDQTGWGFWAAERKDTNDFIGFIGINYSADGLPFAPCVDIGWRLATQHWGLGFATEGAFGAMDYAFGLANLKQLVSMTPISNSASENVMKKLGMTKQAESFLHPKLEIGHPLREHVLYKMSETSWRLMPR